MSRRKRKRRPQGFSERPFKSTYHMMLGRFGVKGTEKREFFNDLALGVALALGAVAGLGGYAVFAEILGTAGGVIVGLLAAIGGFLIVADWMERDRYFRP